MITWRGELHHGWGVGITGGEGEGQLVAESFIDCAVCSSNGGHPVEQVVSIGEGRYAGVTRGLHERGHQRKVQDRAKPYHELHEVLSKPFCD